jgi:hypothetical protein
MRLVVWGAALALVSCSTWPQRTAANATELRKLLAPAASIRLSPLPTERGCGPVGCQVDVGGRLSIRRDPGAIDAAGTGRLRLVEHMHQGVETLPELDWTPLDAYQVDAGGRLWGVCLEFAHAGIGKSGVHQRWTSVVLVPFEGGKAQPAAQRMVGYWTGCDALQAGATDGEVELAVVQRKGGGMAGALEIVRYGCGPKVCTAAVDARRVAGDSAGASGTLVVGSP